MPPAASVDIMSDETTVKVRALMNLGQLGLRYDEEGEFPVEQVQSLLDRGRVELVEEPKPKRTRSTRAPEDDEPTPAAVEDTTEAE